MSQYRLAEIRERFAKYKGGYVYYRKDEVLGIAYLALVNPENNAITGKMMVDLEVNVDNLAKWKTGKGVILYCGNPNFSLGLDKKFAVENQSTSFAQDMSYFITKVLISLSKLPFITVCLLTGVTEGLGAEIPLYCDYVVMHNEATLSFNHAYMGITPGLLGATRLCETVGKKVCMELLLSCRILNAKAAKRLKIVDMILNGVKLVNQTSEWLSTKVLDKSSIIVQSIKRICSCSNTTIGTYGCVFERNSFALLWSSHAQPDAMDTLLPISSSDESDNGIEAEEDVEVDVVNLDASMEEEPGASAGPRIDTENNN